MDRQVPALNTGLRELYPLFCGFEDCSSGHSFGPAVRDYYLIHCVTSGFGTFYSRKKEYRLSRGQCFFICPDEVTFYKADDDNPWSYTWIAFSGENAALFTRLAGLDGEPVFGSEKITEIFENLRRQIADGALDNEKNEFAMLSVLYAVFAQLPRKAASESQREFYVRQVRNYVDNMVSNPIYVQRIADFCRLDRHYLCRIFKAETGLTLQQYVIDCKMRKAKNLLLLSDISVGDVARSVGYYDAFNFSKMFKKHFGLSPTEFRKSAKKGQDND